MMPMMPIQVSESQSLNDILSDDLEPRSSSLLPYSTLDDLFLFSEKSEQQESKITSLPDIDQEYNIRHFDTFSLMIQVQEVDDVVASHNQTQIQAQRHFLKEMVSKEKKRFIQDSFNLDLSYITSNIIAMGFPAESFESIYRNSMSEVQRFLNTRHPQNYKVYNLCSEKKYKKECFYQVEEFPFDDHQAPPFLLIGKFCQNIHEWLWGHEERVAAVHCKAGKGRTGVMICCYLLYIHKFESAKDVLRYYGLIRTQDSKGVTIPSQIRYVEYFSQAIHRNRIFRNACTLELVSVKLIGLPNFGLFGGCDPFIRLQNNQQQLVRHHCVKQEKDIGNCNFEFESVYLTGDTLLQFFHQSIVSDKKMFQLWFHTNFVSFTQIFKRDELDSVSRDKKFKLFPANLELELIFQVPSTIRKRSNCIAK